MIEALTADLAHLYPTWCRGSEWLMLDWDFICLENCPTVDARLFEEA